MCNKCGSDSEHYGYCRKCAKEICKDCASSTDLFIHKTCLNVTPGITRDPGIADDPGITPRDPGIGFGPL